MNSVDYIDQIDLDFDGIVLPMCATSYCTDPVADGKVYCASCRQHLFRNWYRPAESVRKDNNCRVRGCREASTFYLCPNHALPGMIHPVLKLNDGVLSIWLVQRFGRPYLIGALDYALGHRFGGREAFEQCLRHEGYKIRHVVADPEELESIQRHNPTISIEL